MSSGPNRQATELRELGDDELRSKLRESKEELFNLRFQGATGQLDNNKRLQVVRREIARIYTVMRERELGIAPVVVAPVEVEKPKRKAKKTDGEAGKSDADDAAEKEKSEVSA